jgi:glycerate dehydrogenase
LTAIRNALSWSAMRIVILDGHVLNPGDLSWAPLHELGSCTVHDRTAPDQIVARAQGAEVVLTNKCPLTAETIARLPALRYIGVMATGHNIVDSAAAKAAGIVVTNVPTYGTRSVAQHTFALILELTNHVGLHARTVREGRWTRNADWCYWDQPLVELDQRVLGVIGYGKIGQKVADLGRAFGMEVLVHSRSETPGATKVSVDEIFRRSDVISLHCPLTPETNGLVNRERLALMKRSALLINTSRGLLVVDRDLADALNAGQIAGAALDVLSAEPPPAENPLLTARNCLITPHIAWASGSARARLLEVVVSNVKAWRAGSARNIL